MGRKRPLSPWGEAENKEVRGRRVSNGMGEEREGGKEDEGGVVGPQKAFPWLTD